MARSAYLPTWPVIAIGTAFLVAIAAVYWTRSETLPRQECAATEDIHFRIGSLLLRVPRSHKPFIGNPDHPQRATALGRPICDYSAEMPAVVDHVLTQPHLNLWRGDGDSFALPIVATLFRKCIPHGASHRPEPVLGQAPEDASLKEAINQRTDIRRVFFPPITDSHLFKEAAHRVECRSHPPSFQDTVCELHMEIDGICTRTTFGLHNLPISSTREFSAQAERYIRRLVVER
jgi:hypothetical protein